MKNKNSMKSKKWIINKHETKEIKVDNINNVSDEKFKKLIEERFQEFQNLKTETEIKIQNLEFLLGETPYRKLTTDMIKEEIIEGSSIFTLLIYLTIIESIVISFFIINNIKVENYDSLVEILLIFTLIGFTILNYLINKIRHKKVLEFTEDNYLNSKLFKSEYIKVYKRLDFASKRNTWNYYLKFFDECDKIKKVKINKIIYDTLNQPNSSKSIYVLRFPTYPRKNKYTVFLSDKFENLSSIKEESKHSINN